MTEQTECRDGNSIKFQQVWSASLLPLQQNRFAEWAEAKAIGWVGRQCASGACPLAIFLNDELGGTWRVDYNPRMKVAAAICNETGEGYTLPRWAFDFAVTVDAGQQHELTGLDVLNILLSYQPIQQAA